MYMKRGRLHRAVTRTNAELQLEDISHVISKLHIHDLVDWYHIPKSHVRAMDGGTLLEKYDTIEHLVRAYYPSHPWDHAKFMQSNSKRHFGTPQMFLQRVVRGIFPATTIIQMNARSQSTPYHHHHGIVGTKGRPLEIDVYLPEMKLGFEYQDPHHYFQSQFGGHTLAEYQERDEIKRRQAQQQGIILVIVPFWWAGDQESLVASVKRENNTLLCHLESSAVPFSHEPPQHIMDKYNFDIPNLGQPMLVLHAPRSSTFDPTNMLLFEKYDGIRAIWHPEISEFYSRWGRVLAVPHYMKDVMPRRVWLDGEIWFGYDRGARFNAIRLARVSPYLVDWKEAKYIVFDSPQPNLRSSSALERFAFLKTVLPEFMNDFVRLTKYEVCNGREFVEDRFFSIREKGGEGVILLDPSSPYVSGYSKFVFKYKGYYDSEAMVVRRLSEKIFRCQIVQQSTHSKEAGFVEIEMELDDSFEGDARELTEGGDVFVSYKYTGSHPNGQPFRPMIIALRADVTSWDQLRNSHSTKSSVYDQIWKPKLNSNWSEHDTRKSFFDNFAKINGFDPLVVEHWYRFSSQDIAKKGGYGVLWHYNSSLYDALPAVYPNLSFDRSKFKVTPRDYWKDATNRRKFFDDFAHKMNFDPLVRENWQPITFSKVLEAKFGRSALRYHKSLPEALEGAYPDSTATNL